MLISPLFFFILWILSIVKCLYSKRKVSFTTKMESALNLTGGEWPVNKIIQVKDRSRIDKTKTYMGAKESWAKLHVCSSDNLAEVVSACTSGLESYVIVKTDDPGVRYQEGGATLARGTCHYHFIHFCQ